MVVVVVVKSWGWLHSPGRSAAPAAASGSQRGSRQLLMDVVPMMLCDNCVATEPPGEEGGRSGVCQLLEAAASGVPRAQHEDWITCRVMLADRTG